MLDQFGGIESLGKRIRGTAVFNKIPAVVKIQKIQIFDNLNMI
jgi:hypothetical protein